MRMTTGQLLEDMEEKVDAAEKRSQELLDITKSMDKKLADLATKPTAVVPASYRFDVKRDARGFIVSIDAHIIRSK